MKLAAALVLAALMCVASATTLDAQRAEFSAWMQYHGREYATAEEQERRFEIFASNAARYAALNADPREQAVYAVNEYSDLSTDEFLDKMTGFRPAGRASDAMPANARLSAPRNDLPEETNWCDKGACNTPRNQGACGSCWAFSTIGGLEGQVFKLTGALPALSEQQLLDCDDVDGACQGGLMHTALQYYVDKNHGASDTQESYPYHARKDSCHADSATEGIANVSGYKLYCNLFDKEHPEPCDETAMQQTLLDNGPLMVALNAELLQGYFGGIVGTWLPCPGGPNHGVVIVGYGTHKGTPFWTVRNSWGSSWGEKGYFRILRGKGTCDINSYVVTADFAAAPSL